MAIRISAEILGKRVLLRANSWRFSYSPKVVLYVLRCRKENGLPQVCALVRNDMLKTDMRLRVQGHGAGVLLGKVLANADTLQTSACHCEERSDAAIRIPAEVHNKEQYFRRNGKWCGFA